VNLHERIESIKSKEDLADFVEALRSDLEVNAADWENPTLDRFLEAMAVWIRSLDQYYKNTGQPRADLPSWKTLADILYASKIYE
jgi:hypothetical protein